jgi:hypothetical protein
MKLAASILTAHSYSKIQLQQPWARISFPVKIAQLSVFGLMFVGTQRDVRPRQGSSRADFDVHAGRAYFRLALLPSAPRPQPNRAKIIVFALRTSN